MTHHAPALAGEHSSTSWQQPGVGYPEQQQTNGGAGVPGGDSEEFGGFHHGGGASMAPRREVYGDRSHRVEQDQVPHPYPQCSAQLAPSDALSQLVNCLLVYRATPPFKG